MHLRTTYSHSRLFFYREILNGTAFRQLMKRWHLNIVNRFDTSLFKHLVGAFLGFAAGDCLPDILRPFVAGLFIPLLVIFTVSYHMIAQFKTVNSDVDGQQNGFLFGLYSAVVLFFTLAAIRGNGSLKNETMQRYSHDLLKKKPYLKTPRAYCEECEVVKAFRIHHCPSCKSCIPKYTRHSLLLNQCIGAGNEILYLGIVLSLFLAQTWALLEFTIHHRQEVEMSLASKVSFYIINIYVCWLALSDVLTIFIYVQRK